MPFKVCRIAGVSQLDSIPVAVIKDYPLEERDYKPYAQVNLCLDEEDLLLRMWAFEVSPSPGSAMKAVLYLFPERPETALSVTMAPEGEWAVSLLERDGEKPLSPPEGLRPHPHSGEDLQGIYWGGTLTLPRPWLEELAGRAALGEGDVFLGNFYKLCPGPGQSHQGSFFPADFLGDPFSKTSMGDLWVVSY